MEKIKNYLIGIQLIVIIALLLTKGCGDTIYQERVVESIKIDTIWSKETVVKFKPLKPKHDTIYKIDTLIENIPLDTLKYVREYNDSLADTNITIYSKMRVFGILDSIDLSYKLKSKPILITKTIDKTVVKSPRLNIYSGAIIGTNKTIAPYINININKTSFIYSFELVNKTHSIGVGYKIFEEKR